MIKVVFEASLLDCFERLLLQDESIFIITVPFNFSCFQVAVNGFQLVRVVACRDVSFLLQTLIATHNVIILRCSNKLVYLIQVLFLVRNDTALKHCILTRRNIRNSWIDHLLLGFYINEFSWIFWLLNIKDIIFMDFLVDLKLLPLIFDKLVSKHGGRNSVRLRLYRVPHIPIRQVSLLSW